MDRVALLKRPPPPPPSPPQALSEALTPWARLAGSRSRHVPRTSSSPKLRSLGPSLCVSLSSPKGISKLRQSCSFTSRRAPLFSTVASAESNGRESRSIGTPLEPQSPEGSFLCGVLKNQPHIFPIAVEEQLEELAYQRESAFARHERSIGSEESCLHRRIAEMKDNECQIAVEDIIYMSIVHKFSEIEVPMVPKLSKLITNGELEICPSKDTSLESVHQPEILELVREHLSNILKWTRQSNSIEIKRLQFGRHYAASIMYGYFLKSVSLRFQLELSLNPIQEVLPLDCFANARSQNPHKKKQENSIHLDYSFDTATTSSTSPRSGSDLRLKASALRGYVMGFDSKVLQLCAKLRSREAVSVIEKHTWALFGDGEDKEAESNEVVRVSPSGLKRLVLEAVAFGSFLWDVENYVDSVYKLKES
ncbi:UV-B-induced protein, chloroplastic [Ananas comosus]|uniref:UV-B-induced protein, chloroplastic n=1 Tax=Ananas comosus TaxID=4615 RepID=A0A199VW76_ANACO|nr:UV-B-induced protein, chloroplastic [Ananas comosus]